jgi:NAD(P)-dependent dehydrogenase (short-subunit alcohol dehydrogenase family)
MQLNSVRAVITGGVSGLGFAVAQHLVANGGKVALFDVNDDKGPRPSPNSAIRMRAISAPTSPMKPPSSPTSPRRRISSAD